jgi:hypothetical protein
MSGQLYFTSGVPLAGPLDGTELHPADGNAPEALSVAQIRDWIESTPGVWTALQNLGNELEVDSTINVTAPVLLLPVAVGLASYLFAALPVPGAPGVLAVVTDSTVNTWGTVILGGGLHVVLAWWNGVNWTVVGI